LVPPNWLKRLSLWLAGASAVCILLSIAVSQVLLALALGVLLLSGLPLRWPRIAAPLGLFLVWTFVALGFSPDAGHGLSQVRKMFVFLILLIVFSTVRRLIEAKWLAFAWMAVGTATAGKGVVQFARDVAGARAARQDFYHFYLADRIRGFMSHWMTFSGQELYVLLLLMAFLLFAPDLKKRLWLWLPCACLVGIALILSETRSIWGAAIVAGFYLLWHWKKWAALAMPAALALVLLAAPAAIQQRARSIFRPHGEADSNEHRALCRRIGWQMIKAHPIVGVGPDEIRKPQVVDAYLPRDVQKPLPEGYYGHLHNIYVQYAAERGVPAALLITGALLMALIDFRRTLRMLPPGRSDVRFFLHAAIACIIGTMVSGWWEYNLNDTEVLTMFLAIVSVGYVAVERAKNARESSHDPLL
jgi:O-antigen ligase